MIAMTRTTLFRAILLTTAGGAFPMAAHAEPIVSGPSDAPDAIAAQKAAEPDADKPADIIVTASKRPERVTDVPYSITAIGQKEIEDRGAHDIKDLQYSVPGLNIQELSPGANKTTLRGINPGSGTGLPIVSTYVDDVGISVDQQQRDGLFPLVDLARVEVLRGPQGTLYGQGAVAGTIRYITRDPSLTSFGGWGEGNVYLQDKGGTGFRFSGALGGPIVENKVGLRIAGGYEDLAGWIDYPKANGGAGVKDANKSSRVYIRPKLLIKPSDALRISLMYQYYHQKSDTDGISGFGSNEKRATAVLLPAQDTLNLFNGIIDYDFGPVTLTSSTGYQDRDLSFNSALGPYVVVFPTNFKQFSQEVRLSSNGAGPLKYTVGGWYQNFRSNIERVAYIGGVAQAVLRRSGDDPVDSESFAFFGDATYSISSKFDAEVGGRYYDDTRTSGSIIPLVAAARAHFTSFSPKGTIKYKWTDDSSTYLTVSKGFRSGGFNGNGSAFGPETVWNYEVGSKLQLFGGRVFLDIAGYYLDYNNRQTQSLVELVPGVFQTITTNAGAASGPGVEGAVHARLFAGLELDATAAYNDITADVSNVEVVKGERFANVPAFTASASLSQRFDLATDLKGMWRFDFQHSDPYTSIYRTTAGTPPTVVTLENYRNQPQDYINLRVGIEKRRWGAYIDVQNLTNVDTALATNPPYVATLEATRPRPRTVGFTFRLNYDK